MMPASEKTAPFSAPRPLPGLPPGRKLRVGRISYLNVAPVYFGLDESGTAPNMRLHRAPPSELNRMLAAGELDISPVSSAAYARNQDRWLVLPDLSIACDGPVMSVLLVSRRPLWELDGRMVRLTSESATAAALTRCLLASGGAHPHFRPGTVKTPEDIPQDTDAALVIGDAALCHNWAGHFPHIHDLGDLWRRKTGHPFVFALWAVRREIALRFPEAVARVHKDLVASRNEGRRQMDVIIHRAAPRLGLTPADCRLYYRRLQYGLPPAFQRGLMQFFTALHEMRLIPQPETPDFFRHGRFPASFGGQAA